MEDLTYTYCCNRTFHVHLLLQWNIQRTLIAAMEHLTYTYIKEGKRAQEPREKGQTTIYKTLHIKLNIE
jgi:hypothetical protein